MLKPLLITGLLSISTMAWSAVDWTPYLQIIKDDGCEFAIMDIPQEVLGGGSRADIPKKLQPTIASYKHTANGLDVHLKDATAFGYPITRIVARTTNNDAFLDVYFANANFTQLKSQFTTEVDGKTYTVGTKRAWGIRDTRIETGEMDEFDNPVTLIQYTPISWQQKQQLQNRIESSGFDALFEIDENGWKYSTDKIYSAFTFDTKNQSILCGSTI